ncbi:MAG: heme lyase CcmF/NrfE family subunit [Myxococcota bacterium]
MSDLGQPALLLALTIAVLGLAAGVFAGVRHSSEWTRVTERSVLLVFALMSAAMLGLFAAFAGYDYTFQYVATHSARSMPLHYRLAALWGGQAGSLLLWGWMLSAYGAAAVLVSRHSSRALMPWVCVMLLANCIFFLVLLNFVTDPFERLPAGDVPSDGSGLNPLLQHPVMMIHPLMLYTGFVGFVVPFSFAFAAMVTGELGSAWLRTTRRWTLFPWFFLSIGILLGGRWAYEVLGWGGYWAWDPVENASFMPWIAGTAYLHSVMIQEKRDMLKTWNLVLIGLTYSLCLFGTFLTRSGVVQSVHSFTNSGWFGFIFLAYVLGAALLFFGALLYRRKEIKSSNRLESVISRESSFVINNWVFMALLGVVFCGTMFPVFSEWFTGRQIMVGPKFFNTMSGPLALMLLFLTGVGPLIAWRRASATSLRRQFLWPATTCGLVAVGLLVGFRGEIGFYPLALWSLGAFGLSTVVQEYTRAIRARLRRGEENVLQALRTLLRKNQQRYGGYVVHAGVIFILFGVAGAAFTDERLENVEVGHTLELNGYSLRYLTAEPIPKQHYGGAVARLARHHHGEPLGVLAPEKRMYWLEQQPASIPAIHSTLREDLYVVLTEVERDGSATFKIYRNPLVNWIWIGGYTLVLGTLLIMWPHPVRPAAHRDA